MGTDEKNPGWKPALTGMSFPLLSLAWVMSYTLNIDAMSIKMELNVMYRPGHILLKYKEENKTMDPRDMCMMHGVYLLPHPKAASGAFTFFPG